MTPSIATPDTLDRHMKRARLLRSQAMRAGARQIGRAVADTLVRAFVRPYRLRRVPGCGCEA